MSGETFTKWWRRNRDRIGEGHLTVEEAAAEVEPVRRKRTLAEVLENCDELAKRFEDGEPA